MKAKVSLANIEQIVLHITLNLDNCQGMNQNL